MTEEPTSAEPTAKEPGLTSYSELSEERERELETEFLQTHPDCKKFYIARHNAKSFLKTLWPAHLFALLIMLLPLHTGMVYHEIGAFPLIIMIVAMLIWNFVNRRNRGLKKELLYLKKYATWLKNEKGVLYSLPESAPQKHHAIYNSLDPNKPM